jgi:hypothetical protein
MDTEVMFKVVLPLLEVDDTVIIMISTLVDQWNFFTQLLDKGNQEMLTDHPRILVFRQRLICDRCAKKREHATECSHCEADVPPWKRSSTRELVRVVLGDHNVSIYLRESTGTISDFPDVIFSPQAARRMLATPFIKRREDLRPTEVFVSVDPNNGGGSHTAITACVRLNGMLIVCGMESMRTTDPAEIRCLISYFVTQLREDPWLSGAKIVYACENNNVVIMGLMEEVMPAFDNVHRVHERPNRPPGVNTDAWKKNLYAHLMRQELNRGAVHFLENFITCFDMPSLPGGNGRLTSAGMTSEEACTAHRRELFEEVKRARPIYSKQATDLNKVMVGWSAKCDAEGKPCPGLNDDLLLSLCINTYILRSWEEDTLYSKLFMPQQTSGIGGFCAPETPGISTAIANGIPYHSVIHSHLAQTSMPMVMAY